MSADVLRRAASLMRERASGARNNNPWMVDSDRPNVVLDPDKPGNDWDGLAVCEVPLADGGLVDFPTVEHIASWHPAVALAVADWLDGRGRLRRELRAVRHDDDQRPRCRSHLPQRARMNASSSLLARALVALIWRLDRAFHKAH